MPIIGSQYDHEKAMRSQTYAYECWYNVKYEGNTIGLGTDNNLSVSSNNSVEENEFINKWESWFSTWTNDVNAERTEYEISDEDWELAELEGKEEAKEESGHDGESWRDIAVTTGNSTLSVASGAAAGGSIAAGVAAGKAAADAATAAAAAKSAGSAFITANGTAGANAAGNTFLNARAGAGLADKAAQGAAKAAKAICYIGCAMSLAVGILYECLRPNKDSYEALMKLNEMLKQANSDIDFDKTQLDAMSEVITQEATGAENEQQTKQKELEQKAMLLFAATMFREEIRARIDAGEQITPEELAKYEQTGELLGQLQGEVKTLKTELGVTKDEITASIGAKQEEYNAIAERIANTVGMTDFIAQFDETTRNLCITEAAMQGLNVVSGAISGAQAIATGPWGWAFAAMGFAGAGMSAHGVIEQTKMAVDLNNVIKLRTDTQTKVSDTTNVYYAALDKYAVDMEVLGAVDLDIEKESTAISEELAQETPTVDTTAEDTNPFGGNSTENEDPKKNPFM